MCSSDLGTPGTIFEDLNEIQRGNAARLVAELIAEREQPDLTHPANQPPPFTDQMTQDMAHELFNDTRRGDDPDAPRNLEDLRTTLQALETGNFDDMRFRGYTPAVQSQIQRDVAHYIREIMDDAGVRLPNTHPGTQALSDHDLHQRVLTHMPTGDGWRRLNERTDEIALAAQTNNTPIERLQHLIRNGDVNMTGFNPYEREYIAREVANLMRLYNREPQNAPVPAQPNVAPYRPIAQDVSNMPSTALFASLSPMMVHNVTTLANQITDVNTPAEVENIIGLVRSHSMGGWEDFVPQQREYLARTLQEYVDTQIGRAHV